MQLFFQWNIFSKMRCEKCAKSGTEIQHFCHRKQCIPPSNSIDAPSVESSLIFLTCIFKAILNYFTIKFCQRQWHVLQDDLNLSIFYEYCKMLRKMLELFFSLLDSHSSLLILLFHLCSRNYSKRLARIYLRSQSWQKVVGLWWPNRSNLDWKFEFSHGWK